MARKKIISAGPLVQAAVYKTARTARGDAQRGRKRNATSDAQRLINARCSWQKLKLLLAANFIRGDIVGCLTFDDAHLPETRAQVDNRLKWFRQKLTAARRARGQELVMFWSIEHRHGEGRWHVHFVANATGDDYAEIARLWAHGEVDLRALRCDKAKNYESLARYMCKETRERLGQRAWSYTRNAKQPEVESFWVPDDTVLRIPKGTVVFADVRSRGEWQFVEYAYEDALRRRRRPRRPKRRR